MISHVIFSGGLDSTVALALALEHRGRTKAISFDYGQRHAVEIRAAKKIAQRYRVPLEVIDLRGILHSRSLLASSTEEIPHEEYASENISSTEVHGRNLLFASIAISKAQKGDTIFIGVHGGDHELYPDCRPEFWEGVKALAGAYGVEVHTPFLNAHKSDIVKLGARLEAPLALTWSCYNGGRAHCGRCATCLERKEAFATARVKDPTMYLE